MGIINQTRKALSKSIYMPEDELTVFATAIVVAHTVGMHSRIPRVMLSSERGGFGKSQALRAVSYTTPNPWYLSGKNTSQPSIRSHLMRPERPTVILDEAAKIFGPSGRQGSQSPVYTMLCDGYDFESTVSVSSNGVDEDSSAYCMMFIGGLKTSLPEDALSRTIRLRMVKRPEHITLTPIYSRRQELEWLRDPIAAWVTENEARIREATTRLGSVHPELVDRVGEVWGPLFAVAMADGPDELDALLRAFARIGLDRPTDSRTMDERVLSEALRLMEGEDVVFSAPVASAVATWPEFGGKTLRQVSITLAGMIESPAVVEDSQARRARGWHRKLIEHRLSEFASESPVEFTPDIYDEMLEDPTVTEVTEITDITHVDEPPASGLLTEDTLRRLLRERILTNMAKLESRLGESEAHATDEWRQLKKHLDETVGNVVD